MTSGGFTGRTPVGAISQNQGRARSAFTCTHLAGTRPAFFPLLFCTPSVLYENYNKIPLIRIPWDQSTRFELQGFRFNCFKPLTINPNKTKFALYRFVKSFSFHEVVKKPRRRKAQRLSATPTVDMDASENEQIQVVEDVSKKGISDCHTVKNVLLPYIINFISVSQIKYMYNMKQQFSAKHRTQ